MLDAFGTELNPGDLVIYFSDYSEYIAVVTNRRTETKISIVDFLYTRSYLNITTVRPDKLIKITREQYEESHSKKWYVNNPITFREYERKFIANAEKFGVTVEPITNFGRKK